MAIVLSLFIAWLLTSKILNALVAIELLCQLYKEHVLWPLNCLSGSVISAH